MLEQDTKDGRAAIGLFQSHCGIVGIKGMIGEKLRYKLSVAVATR